MKKIILLYFLSYLSCICDAQVIVDSCFTSPQVGTTFTSTGDMADVYEADLISWNGSAWVGGFASANINMPPPCTGAGQRAIFIGDSVQWTTGGEGFGLRLDSPMVAGQTYSFTFTYVSNGAFSTGFFSPSFFTNNAPVTAGAVLTGYLVPAGFSWATNTFTFTASAAQNNHNWLILFSNAGSGLVLNGCGGAITSFALGNDTTMCAGDSLLIDAGGGFNTYQWSNGATTQSFYAADSGTYIVAVSNSCIMLTDTIMVSLVSCNQGVSFSSSDTSFCEKACIDFTDLSTNNPISWQWYFPGADSIASNEQNPVGICYSSYGSFDVTLIACNTSDCDTLVIPNFIHEYQSPAVPVITSHVDTLFSTPAYAYQWYDSSGAIAGANGSYYVYQHQGLYYVVVADSNGCATASGFIGTGIDDIQDEAVIIRVYPNPARDILEFTFNASGSGKPLYRICNSIGEQVSGGYVVNREINRIDIHNLAGGIYVILIDAGDKIYRQKFVVMNN